MKTKANNYNEFLSLLNGCGDTYVFRGQHCAYYNLIPSALRTDKISIADKQMVEFVKKMNDKFGFDELTCVEIAQHFSLPTRMLDFSYSFDVALFFACHDRKGRHINEDGKVFIFNKSKYERYLNSAHKFSSIFEKRNKYLYEWLERYISNQADNVYRLDLPVFIDATEQFDRLHMQKGLFLLWGDIEKPLDQLFEDEGLKMSDFIEEIVIDAKAKPIILKELEKKYITSDTLYMNISLINEFVDNIKNEKR